MISVIVTCKEHSYLLVVTTTSEIKGLDIFVINKIFQAKTRSCMLCQFGSLPRIPY